MEKPRELYHEEATNLELFQKKLDNHALYREDLESFAGQYEELIAQAKVITRVSDRLQKKLDSANTQIKEQNEEIKVKNNALETTVQQLAVARVGRRASTIMLTVALVLFVSEQILLQPLIDKYISVPFLDLAILAVLFFLVKFFESTLEGYFMKQEKLKIMKNKEILETTT